MEHGRPRQEGDEERRREGELEVRLVALPRDEETLGGDEHRDRLSKLAWVCGGRHSKASKETGMRKTGLEDLPFLLSEERKVQLEHQNSAKTDLCNSMCSFFDAQHARQQTTAVPVLSSSAPRGIAAGCRDVKKNSEAPQKGELPAPSLRRVDWATSVTANHRHRLRQPDTGHSELPLHHASVGRDDNERRRACRQTCQKPTSSTFG